MHGKYICCVIRLLATSKTGTGDFCINIVDKIITINYPEV